MRNSPGQPPWLVRTCVWVEFPNAFMQEAKEEGWAVVTSTETCPTFPLIMGTSDVTVKKKKWEKKRKSGSLGTKWGTYSRSSDFSLGPEGDWRPSEPRRSELTGQCINKGSCVTHFHLSLLLNTLLWVVMRGTPAGLGMLWKKSDPVMKAETEATRIGHLPSRHFTDTIPRVRSLGLPPCSPQGSSRCGKPEAKCSSDWLRVGSLPSAGSSVKLESMLRPCLIVSCHHTGLPFLLGSWSTFPQLPGS